MPHGFLPGKTKVLGIPSVFTDTCLFEYVYTRVLGNIDMRWFF